MIKNNSDFIIGELIKSWREVNSKHPNSKPIFPSKSINVESKCLKNILLKECAGNKIAIVLNATVYEVSLYANGLPCNVWQIWLKWSSND